MSAGFAFVEDCTPAELRKLAAYLVSLAPDAFAIAAELVEEQRESTAPAVPAGVTRLYDWAAERAFEDAPAPECTPETAPAGTGAPGYAAPVPDVLCPVAAERFAVDLAASKLPSLRRIRSELRVGQPRASRIRAHLAELTRAA